MRLPLRHDSSRVKHDDLVAEGKHFLAIMRDEENRDAVMLVPPAQIADQRRLRRTIQRSQWLIEQQRARFGHQRARQGDALALTSRNLRWSPVAQVIDAERGEHFAAARSPLRRAERAKAVSDVFLGGQVREERQVLMYVPDAPFPGGDVAFLLRVVKVFTANGDAPVVRIDQSGNAIEQRGFSRARSAEENRKTGKRAEVDIQVEAALGIRKAFADADFEVGRDWLCRSCNAAGSAGCGARQRVFTAMDPPPMDAGSSRTQSTTQGMK